MHKHTVQHMIKQEPTTSDACYNDITVIRHCLFYIHKSPHRALHYRTILDIK